MSSTAPQRSDLEWPEHEPYEDVTLGNLKSGKEAEIFLVERRYTSGPRLLAHKRYRPRYPTKGQLREEGFSNSTSYPVCATSCAVRRSAKPCSVVGHDGRSSGRRFGLK